MKLDSRLATIAALVKENEVVLDIGTDHGWLPIEMLKSSHINQAILADINVGPLENAKQNIEKHNLSNKVTTVLSDGFKQIEQDFDVAIIAGMGGYAINEILNGAVKLDKRCILQPNNGEYLLRQGLVKMCLRIVQEFIIEENNKIYEIIVVEPGEESLTEKQLMFGKFLLEEKSPVFCKKWTYEMEYLNSCLTKIANNIEREKISDKIKLLKEVLC